jgi:hypothetical protein
MMKKPVLISIILLLVLIIPSLLMAQGGPPDPVDPLVPIDGGLSLLVAAAVGYGSKKMYDSRKK